MKGVIPGITHAFSVWRINNDSVKGVVLDGWDEIQTVAESDFILSHGTIIIKGDGRSKEEGSHPIDVGTCRFGGTCRPPRWLCSPAQSGQRTL